jgi:hypothetical protein
MTSFSIYYDLSFVRDRWMFVCTMYINLGCCLLFATGFK